MALRVCAAPLRAPLHELLYLFYLQPRSFQALDDAQSLQLALAEAADAGASLHLREQPLFIIISQRGYWKREHLRYLTYRIHMRFLC